MSLATQKLAAVLISRLTLGQLALASHLIVQKISFIHNRIFSNKLKLALAIFLAVFEISMINSFGRLLFPLPVGPSAHPVALVLVFILFICIYSKVLFLFIPNKVISVCKDIDAPLHLP